MTVCKSSVFVSDSAGGVRHVDAVFVLFEMLWHVVAPEGLDGVKFVIVLNMEPMTLLSFVICILIILVAVLNNSIVNLSLSECFVFL